MASSLIAPRMTDAEYFSTPGLSHSGMRDLAVSPLRYWHLHVNPNRPTDEPTPEMEIGHALHCAILERSEFDKRYACEVVPPDLCLDTIEDMRGFLREIGVTPKGTRKAEMISQVQTVAPDAPILEVLRERHADQHAGKLIFKVEEWLRIAGAAQAMTEEPRVQAILDAEGQAEAQLFAKDPETGVPLKAKLDWLAPNLTLDLKTFSQKRGKSIDKSIADAIFYEQYYRQAFFYGLLRGWPQSWPGEFVMAFVESEPPHEVRIRALRPKTGGNVNLYWERARIEVRQLIRTYAECMDKFGVDRPWRYAQEITPLADEEMPGMVFAA